MFEHSYCYFIHGRYLIWCVSCYCDSVKLLRIKKRCRNELPEMSNTKEEKRENIWKVDTFVPIALRESDSATSISDSTTRFLMWPWENHLTFISPFSLLQYWHCALLKGRETGTAFGLISTQRSCHVGNDFFMNDFLKENIIYNTFSFWTRHSTWCLRLTPFCFISHIRIK